MLIYLRHLLNVYCLHLLFRLLLQMYCLLSRVATMVPLLSRRRPLFVPTTTRAGTTVEFQGNNTVLKQIEGFGAFAEENCTSFQEVKEAYAAAAEAAADAARQPADAPLVGLGHLRSDGVTLRNLPGASRAARLYCTANQRAGGRGIPDWMWHTSKLQPPATPWR